MKVVLVLAVVSVVVAIPGWQAVFRAFYPRGGIIWGNTACIGKRGGARRSLVWLSTAIASLPFTFLFLSRADS